MPNWCENTLWVSVIDPEVKTDEKGLNSKQKKEQLLSREELHRFRSIAEKKIDSMDSLSLDAVIPCPKELDEPFCKGGPFQHIDKVDLTNEQRDAIDKWKDKVIAKRKKKYGFDNGYDWRITNWGTKWDVESDIFDMDDTVSYNFCSAWAPPIEWIRLASKEFKRLEFKIKYEEPGMCFMGVAKSINGEVEDDCLGW